MQCLLQISQKMGGSEKIEWGEAQECAVDTLKQHLSNALILKVTEIVSVGQIHKTLNGVVLMQELDGDFLSLIQVRSSLKSYRVSCELT